MKALKTLGFIGLFFLLNTIGYYIGYYGGGLLMNALNYNSFIGQLLFLIIFGTVIGNYTFWGMIFISKVLPSKASATFSIVFVIAAYIVGNLSAITDWVFALLLIIQIISAIIPLFSRRCILEDEEIKQRQTITTQPSYTSSPTPEYQEYICPSCNQRFMNKGLPKFCPKCGYHVENPRN